MVTGAESAKAAAERNRVTTSDKRKRLRCTDGASNSKLISVILALADFPDEQYAIVEMQ